MLQKWKLILSNWINCYFKESNKKDLAVNFESLIDVISHLRENLNNSISNSSLLDANTIQEFIVEKYPDFKFENGSVEPDSEDEVYLAGSLLLFFVCLNSKNVDLKNAMCSKLCPSDQETILKFSKHLMECPKITYTDVQAAIAEACGQDIAAVTQPSIPLMVAETPPALRSYHSEVRRLQAALDAERFDRNYLQEELNRTNLKVEKLLKDKEQYKLEIVDLKAQISLYCGQDKECPGDDVEANKTSKIVKQLEQMEQRLLDTQEQLEDVQYERDTYKSKLNQLKTEHDKLLALNQQESARANGLAEDLECERRHNQSLRELVAELRQHNHLNRMDSSLLECDDPDASINSLQHNSSACSEVCANVIEVQLGEERARNVALRQQLQLSQEQHSEVTRKAEEETQSLKIIIKEKENTILDLKHHLNEEVGEKNTLKAIFNDEVSKLNNELNEMDQRLKGSQENSRNIIENKMQEIQNLQEEKLSLLQSLSDETTKLDNIIKDLQYEVDLEKSSKIRLREEYDSHIMKLNEKVLNRNNELVELQNKIVEKGEKIEALQFELKREKELKDDLSNKHNHDIIQLNSIRERIEQDLQKKSEEVSNLQQHLQQHMCVIEQINEENSHLKTTIMQLQDDCKILNDKKEKLLVEIKNRDVQAEQTYKETENLKNLLSEEKQKLQHNLEETSATVNALQNQSTKLKKSEDKNSELLKEITKLNTEINTLTLEKDENEGLIKKLNDTLTEQNKINEILKQDLCEVNSKLEQLSIEITKNNNIIKEIKGEMDKNKNEYQEKLNSKNLVIETIEKKLEVEIAEKNDLREQFNSLENERDTLLEKLNEKENKVLQIQSEYKEYEEKLNSKNAVIETIEKKLEVEIAQKTYLQEQFNSLEIERDSLLEKLNEKEKKLLQIESEYKEYEEELNSKNAVIETIEKKLEVEIAQKTYLQEQFNSLENERDSLLEKLNEKENKVLQIESEYKEYEEELNSKNAVIETIEKKLEVEIAQKTYLQEQFNSLENERDSLLEKLNEKENKVLQIQSEYQEKLNNKNAAIKTIEKKLEVEIAEKNDLQEQFSSLENEKDKLLDKLNENEIKLLQIQSEYIEYQEKLNSKNAAIETIEKKLEVEIAEKNDLREQFNSLENERDSLLEKLNEKENTLLQIESEYKEYQEKRNSKNADIETIEKKLEVEIAQKTYLQEQFNSLEIERDSLLEKLNEKENKLLQIQSEYQEKLNNKNAAIKTIEKKLEVEIAEKNDLQEQFNSLENERDSLLEKLNEKENKLLQIESEYKEYQEKRNSKNADIETIEKKLEVEIAQKTYLQEQFNTLEIERDSLLEKLNEKENKLLQIESEYKEYQEKRNSKNAVIETIEKKLEVEIAQKNDLQEQFNSLENEKDKLLEKLNEKENKLLQIQSEYNNLSILNEKDKISVQILQESILDREKKYSQLENEFHAKISNLETKLREAENSLAEADASKNSSHYNSCTCSETSTNVIEEQLDEERAKTVALKEQLELLQEQRSEVTRKANEETQSLRVIITEKESNIMDLKHRVNEEIEENNTLKVTFNNEVSKLRNELNELEQRLKGSQENQRNIIENKMQEIQNLQEEKLSLLQSLSDETMKLENIIKDLQYEVDSEKSAKIRLRDEYDSQIMKLNEKVLNRNNELVELQNKILEKGEKIEDLQFELKREKESKEELSNEHNHDIIQLNSIRERIEQDLQKTTEDANNLQRHLQQQISVIEQINKENSHLKTTIMRLQEDCEILNDTKEKLLVEIRNRDVKVDQISKEAEKFKNLVTEEKQKLHTDSEERSATVTALQNQLQDEIQRKIELQDTVHKSEVEKSELVDEIANLKKEINKFALEKDENERLINKLNETLTEQNKVNEVLKQDLNEVNNKLEQLTLEVSEKNNTMKDMEKEVENNKKEYQEKLNSKNAVIETIEKKLQVEIAQKIELHEKFISLENEKGILLEKLNEKENKLLQIQFEYKDLTELNEKDKKSVQRLQEILLDKELKYTELEKEYHTKIINFETKLRETENSLEEVTTKSCKVVEGKDLLTQTLTVKTEKLEGIIKELQERIAIMEIEKQTIIQQLDKEKSFRSNIEKEYLRICSSLDSVTAKLNEEILKKNREINSMKAEIQSLSHEVAEKTEDTAHSSLESYKTISDLEKIVQDKNRTITTLQSDITYLKSLLAESENNLLDVTKDLEVSKEHCHQLSSQLKKIVHQKNDEIADLKKQVAKMSVNENRASQIIKVSAKYQAIILKRIAEIKSNTVLKELTNFGNTANCDNELRRSLNAGTITMEDLENFLDTTDRHLKRCAEKQLALQKERDRLAEVNKINESEIINMKKFLTELSVSIKTFNSLKDLYTQKLSRVVSLQRTVKREILSLDGRITDGAMCKLQRDYASIMQDLTECAMNMERWVERCLGRAITAEKIKQAFSNEERPSLASTTFQNASLEVQFEELENYFCKLLEEVARAQKGDAKDVQAVTVMEVRAEYEDKLNRMKAKMTQLYKEQIGIFKEKQRAEMLSLEQELQKARDKLEESSRAYEQHIRALTTELWNVGEKFLMKKDEADWLRRKQRSGSLMSLQHVHSSGLVPPQEEPSRPSDTHSLRSLPVATNTNSKNGRALHMSDEEGEVFDNRCLKELASTPARAPPRDPRDPNRLSELQWRNSLCPPHLKSSYPAETQFVPAVHEEDIKCVSGPSMSLGGRSQRKEVGITAYKKPGPPTPSKQAGRLSATDSELRESLRVETEPNASRKTSTPSRIRALFRSNRTETIEGTPRSRRLSNIFRKK